MPGNLAFRRIFCLKPLLRRLRTYPKNRTGGIPMSLIRRIGMSRLRFSDRHLEQHWS